MFIILYKHILEQNKFVLEKSSELLNVQKFILTQNFSTVFLGIIQTEYE